MPNWAYTIYIVRGDEEEVARLHQVIKDLDNRAESLLLNGFGKLWMGNLVHVLGGDWEKVYCRGKILDYEMMADGALRFDVESAWGELDEVRALILSRFPKMDIRFQSEEPGMDYFSTNDDSGTTFSDRWALDWEDETRNLYVHEYFPDLSAVAVFLKEQNIISDVTDPTESVLRSALDAIWNARPDEVCYSLKEVEIKP
jgi:hypothetical protein